MKILTKKSEAKRLGIVFFLSLSLAHLSGCAHKSVSHEIDSDNVPAPKNITDVLQEDLKDRADSRKSAIVVSNGEILIQGIQLKNTRFDIPITINSKVENWINYFCGRGRVYFEKYLERSEFFIPYIAPLLKQNGMPEDLVYLSMIESGFNNLARSRARAVGPWQFMSATGKRYGLMVNWWVDERRDIKKSTLSAVEFLRDLYNIFGSWELAAAAYNAGEAKVARAVRRFGTKDFWSIAGHRFLAAETREYVPKMIAAAIIAKNRTQFGFPETKLIAASDEAVAGDGEVVKVIKTDQPQAGDSDYKADVQSALMDQPTEPDPELVAEATRENIARLNPPDGSTSTTPLAQSIPTPHVSLKGEVGGEELLEFEVQSPADLLKVARAAGLSYHTVKSLNPEVLRWCTPPTVGTYRLKLPSSTKDKFLATYNHDAFPRQVQFMVYKAKKGETLSKIARQFGIKVDPMSDLNRVSPKLTLKHGSQILLPMPNDRSRTFASLEIRDPPEKRRAKHGHRRKAGSFPSKFNKILFKSREQARSSRFIKTRMIRLRESHS